MGISTESVELGIVCVVTSVEEDNLYKLRESLYELGFELIDDRRQQITEQIKNEIIKLVHHDNGCLKENLSDFLTEIMRCEYSQLSKLFSETTGTTIEKYFMKLVSQLKEIGKLSSASKYYFCLSSLSKFKPMNTPFTDIDFQFLKDYEVYLRKKGLANNSIATQFSCFKSTYNKALEEGVFTNEDSPFKKFKVGKLWTQTRKRAIHKEDVQKLKEFDLSTLIKYPTPYLEFARDIFMFSYLTAGINFKDIATLRYCDLDNGRIYYSRHKTQKNMNTILLPDALKILNKYIKKDAGAEDYIFPILDRNIHITEQQQADRVQKVLKQVNRKLKVISKALNLKINLTTYVARHTFATVLKRSGVDIGIISESLGHSDLKTTQIYLDSFENTQIDAAMQNLL